MNDVVIVLGTGIHEDGSIPDSCIACVKKTVELQKEGKVFNILLSGKWAWNLSYQPPITEAEAMEKIALDFGGKNIDLGEEGQTTVHNLCWIKSKYLKWHNYLNPIFIIPSTILKDRFEYNLKMVLGPGYKYQIVFADFDYTQEIETKLIEQERQKLQDCINFYQNINPGDDQKIYELSLIDLKENYKK